MKYACGLIPRKSLLDEEWSKYQVIAGYDKEIFMNIFDSHISIEWS